ncbi:hypothetical protein [Pseudomonas zeae]|uniref:hypothetical protein n=1 Tax=Pseudomonas zeae TaxID=2745510 RepID=UPI0039E05631
MNSSISHLCIESPFSASFFDDDVSIASSELEAAEHSSTASAQFDSSEYVNRTTSASTKEAALAAISTLGCYDSKYIDPLISMLPKILDWPVWQGLVIQDGERFARHDVISSQAINEGDITSTDIVVCRGNEHYKPFGSHEQSKEVGIFVLLASSQSGKDFESRETLAQVTAMRSQVADYVDHNWAEFKVFWEGDNESVVGAVHLEPLHGVDSNSAATAGMTPETEMNPPASGVGKFIFMLMTQVKVHLSRVLEAIRGQNFSSSEMNGLAQTLRVVNGTISHATPDEKAAWIDSVLEDLFSTDAKHPVSKAQTLLAHRHVPELAPSVHELMILMENAAETLQGAALVRFGQLLGVDAVAGGSDRGIALGFPRVAPEGEVKQSVRSFETRFENLRQEFGMVI